MVGRTAVNCRTLNQPYSFYGVQLGNDRKLLPTSYSIRNRDSSNQVMLSWRLEGSEDLVNWTTLDTRVHNPQNQNSIQLLCQSGATTTWGIDQKICMRIGKMDGFTTFRIV